ncbi:helix-turn-helix transcriptional regulator [Streptomyces sp. NPDC054786]
MDFDELGYFLRVRREALRPIDAGLASGGRRRTPGLRRAEVALLANLSVDYYERLEQGRSGCPSQTLLANLARALMLTSHEEAYLFNLAGYPPAAESGANRGVGSGTLFLLESITAIPATVVDGLTDVLAQNALSVSVTGAWAERPGRQANMAWRWFTEPESRSRIFFNDEEETGREFVASIRATWAARGRDCMSTELIADLKAASSEFTQLWEEMCVGRFSSTSKTLVHPDLGRLDIYRETVAITTTGHLLVLLRPRTDETAERFASITHRTGILEPVGP